VILHGQAEHLAAQLDEAGVFAAVIVVRVGWMVLTVLHGASGVPR